MQPIILNLYKYSKCSIHLGLIIIMFCFNLISSDFSSFKKSQIEDYAKAFDHGVRVRSEGSCRAPHPMIIYVNKTDPSKVHLPRGTVLHRCSDSFGCCENPSESCVPIEMQTVELYFLTITFEIQSRHKNGRVRQTRNIEKLLFNNHTLCGCRERSNDKNDDNNYEENEPDRLNEID